MDVNACRLLEHEIGSTESSHAEPSQGAAQYSALCFIEAILVLGGSRFVGLKSGRVPRKVSPQ
eukprot:3118492-Lingulodinium_polyedra.AAC.1